MVSAELWLAIKKEGVRSRENDNISLGPSLEHKELLTFLLVSAFKNNKMFPLTKYGETHIRLFTMYVS